MGLLSHSCYNWSRWEDYHNMYHDSFNKRGLCPNPTPSRIYGNSFNLISSHPDIPLLLTFFVLVFVTCLVGGLQMYLTKVYWFGAFVALNTLQVSIPQLHHVFHDTPPCPCHTSCCPVLPPPGNICPGSVLLFKLADAGTETQEVWHWKRCGTPNHPWGARLLPPRLLEQLPTPTFTLCSELKRICHTPLVNKYKLNGCLFVMQLEMKGRPSRSPQSPPVVQLEMKGRPSRSPHSPPIVQFNTKDHHSLSPQEEDPIVPLGIKAHTEDSEVTREHDPAALSRSEDSENEDMDALVYAVRTRGTATEDYDSDRSSVQSSAGSEVEFAPRQKASLMSEEYQLRRISIANTHL